MKILIIKPSSLGDVVHALPTANLLRRYFRDAHISWLINDSLVGLLKNCPVINAIVPFYRDRWRSINALPDFFLYLRKLREQQFDIAIDLQGLFRSGVVAKSTGALRRIGFSDAREGARWFYNEIVVMPPNLTHKTGHAVDRYLQVLPHLGCALGPVEFPFGQSAEDKEAVNQFLESNAALKTPLIAVNPCARWDNKRWPAESYAELVRALSGKWKPHRIVLIGGAADAEYLAGIAKQSGSLPIIMAGKLTLAQLVDLLRRCSLYFGNDSGPTHIAAAVAVPSVVLFGPTDPALTGPHSSQRSTCVVLRKEIPCAPCLKPTCHNKAYLECLKTISVKEVVDAAEKLMDRSVARTSDQ